MKRWRWVPSAYADYGDGQGGEVNGKGKGDGDHDGFYSYRLRDGGEGNLSSSEWHLISSAITSEYLVRIR